MSAPFPAPVAPGVTSISLLLWQVRDDQAGYELLGDSLAVSTELASRLLLVAATESGCPMHGSVARALAVGLPPGVPQGHSFAVAALVSWLATEAFGGYMLSSWIGSGGNRVARDAPGTVPRSVIFGHAGLAFTGLVWWISFVLTGDAPLAWLSIGFLAPAIGLGISTLTLWTPYPARPPEAEPARQQYDGMLGITSDELLVAALEDDALTTKLVDDLVASVLDRPDPTPRGPKWQLSPLIPVAHGVLAMSTVLLAVLAAVSTS